MRATTESVALLGASLASAEASVNGCHWRSASLDPTVKRDSAVRRSAVNAATQCDVGPNTAAVPSCDQRRDADASGECGLKSRPLRGGEARGVVDGGQGLERALLDISRHGCASHFGREGTRRGQVVLGLAPHNADAHYAQQSSRRVMRNRGAPPWTEQLEKRVYRRVGLRREDGIVSGEVSDTWIYGLLRSPRPRPA